jgi:transposase-like protein
MTTSAIPTYAGHRFPAEIISHVVWLYFRNCSTHPLEEKHFLINVLWNQRNIYDMVTTSVEAQQANSSAAFYCGAKVVRNIRLRVCLTELEKAAI